MKIPPKMKNDAGKKSFLNRMNRFMWTKLPNYEVVVNVPEADDGDYQRIILTFSRPYGHISIDLTALTSIELAALRETILIATDVARPLVEFLDQKARDNEFNGDDANDRLYRGLPTVVVRKGALRQYSESLLLGREDVLQAVGTQFGSGGSASAGSLEVDNSNEEGGSASNDPQTSGSTG